MVDDSSAADAAVIAFLPFIRAALARKKFREKLLQDISEKFSKANEGEWKLSHADILRWGLLFLRVARFPVDLQILSSICRHMSASMESKEKEYNMATVFIQKATIQLGHKLFAGLFRIIPQAMQSVKGEKVMEQKNWQTLTHWIFLFSTPSTWSLTRSSPNIQPVLASLAAKMSLSLHTPAAQSAIVEVLYRVCCRARPLISRDAVGALFSIMLRPLKESDQDERVVHSLLLPLLCVPAIILHLPEASREQLKSMNVLTRLVRVCNEKPPLILDPCKILNLMGNLIQITFISSDVLPEIVSEWTTLLSYLMEKCHSTLTSSVTRLHTRQYHPIFGNSALLFDYQTEMSFAGMTKQLRLLWSRKIVKILLREDEEEKPVSDKKSLFLLNEHSNSSLLKLWKRLAISGSEEENSPNWERIPVNQHALVAHLFISACKVFSTMWSEILSGLCAEKGVLRRLWHWSQEWEVFRPLLSVSAIHTAPLHLFAETASYLIKIIDDEELYVKEEFLPMAELISVIKFTNSYCFRSIWNMDFEEDAKEETRNRNLFNALHSLTMSLYARHSRRPFCADPKLWLIPDERSIRILSEFANETPRGKILTKRMNHIIPLKERMILFRMFLRNEKDKQKNKTTMMRIVRSQLVVDGYRNLDSLPPCALRGTIRVKFVNQQGLDEAGIDQDGVFKEFLELTLKQVFNPELSLFCFTSAGQLYPSSNSHVHENHLELFKFVGKMLAKAVFEGIVVDVQLAPVLLASLLGVRSLSAFDELAQFDPELYRSLSYVKKCDETEVADLALTFSTDENNFGEIVTVDIVPCGRTFPVTAENRIRYVHRMAHYRVFTQTQLQCRAFVEGFQMVVEPSWLNLFAPHELQVLISGQSSDIDMADLKRHVQYYGGFHSGHRLIKWLWHILEHDFSADERKLFLKFVTSCSRGPLLGFGSLHPPFSIRCVEVSDDQDTGDTLASVVRGFLAMKKEQAAIRLPTASTCFNLLKLPNYNKKSTLLQKLRYAIHSETGFELS